MAVQAQSSQSQGVPALIGTMQRNSDVVLAAGVLVIVAMMIIPLPTVMLDLLVAANIAMAITVLLIAMYTRDVLSFSVFPALLLLVTLFRLAINVSSTRLILLQADAGDIIASFGNFVIGGSVVVGIVVFLILLVIQFVVITNGASRVAEVAARFTLDAMPGKQMSIDADLNAGIISESEARERRQRVTQEADFYGAMDGASKFVKGDAIAGLVIVAINLVGGIAIGTMQSGLSPGEAVSTYSLLTVGDGLVSQIPALLISTATGIIVTRAASEEHLGADIGQQLLSNPRALFIVAAVLAAFGAVPGLPRFPFFLLAATMAGAGYIVRERLRDEAEAETAAVAAEVDEHEHSVDSVVSMLRVDPLEVEVGYGLIPLVDDEHGNNVLNRITIIRRQVATELGIVVPMIRIRDNLQLPPNTYVAKLRGIEIGRGELMVNHFLAMNPGTAVEEIDGTETTEPAFGLPARWVSEAQKPRAELLGYTVVDPPSVLTTHLSELIRRHAPDLLSRQDTQTLLTNLKDEYPTVVEELVPGRAYGRRGPERAAAIARGERLDPRPRHDPRDARGPRSSDEGRRGAHRGSAPGARAPDHDAATPRRRRDPRTDATSGRGARADGRHAADRAGRGDRHRARADAAAARGCRDRARDDGRAGQGAGAPRLGADPASVAQADRTLAADPRGALVPRGRKRGRCRGRGNGGGRQCSLSDSRPRRWRRRTSSSERSSATTP